MLAQHTPRTYQVISQHTHTLYMARVCQYTAILLLWDQLGEMISHWGANYYLYILDNPGRRYSIKKEKEKSITYVSWPKSIERDIELLEHQRGNKNASQ